MKRRFECHLAKGTLQEIMRYQFSSRRRPECNIFRRVLTVCLVLIILFLQVFLITHYVADQMFDDSAKFSKLTEDVQYQSISGASIAYRVHGSGEQTMLLIHGLMGSSYDFAPLWSSLGEEFTMISVDLIGFGLSDKNAELNYSKENMAKICVQLMLELGYSEFTVLGHSMGGEVALNVAYTFPDHAERLILIDSAGIEDLQKGFRNAVPVWLIDYIFQNYLIQRLYFPVGFAEKKLASSELFNQFYFFNRQIPGTALRKLITDNDSGRLKDKLDQIKQHTLIIWGLEDTIIPVEQGYRLEQAISGSSLVVINNAGHLPFLEKPEDVLSAIKAFID